MEQYIPKSAVVTELERRKKAIVDDNGNLGFKDCQKAFNEIDELKKFINTLVVKEVDLEKHLKEDIEDVLFDLDGVAVKGATYYLTVEDVKDIAKHFYELGMVASNKAQEGE